MPTPRLFKSAKGGVGSRPWKTPLTEGAHVIARHVLQSPNGDTHEEDLHQRIPALIPPYRPL
jgi:hypothetical protein